MWNPSSGVNCCKFDGDVATPKKAERRDVLRVPLLLAATSPGAGTGRSITGDNHAGSGSITESDWTMWRFKRGDTRFDPHITRIEEFSFR